jgi:dTDP-4-dehydrorhamnose reductase
MKKILVTGANGLLGQHLVKLLHDNDYVVIATGRGPSRLSPELSDVTYRSLDITDDSALHEIMEAERPVVIIHGAAMTQVDDCELNQQVCLKVNVEGTANLLVMAEAYCERFIYISTDFVFDGEKGFYNEEDALNPVSWYGFTKVQAEATVETCEIPWAIVRTCLVYGNIVSSKRTNIIGWIRDSLTDGKRIKVVSDQVRTPTYVEDLAKGILLIVEKQASGIFHISGKDALSPYEMALATADFLQQDRNLIEKVDASTFTQPGKRPPKTGLNISKAERELGFKPESFKEALKKCLRKT